MSYKYDYKVRGYDHERKQYYTCTGSITTSKYHMVNGAKKLCLASAKKQDPNILEVVDISTKASDLIRALGINIREVK